MKWYQRLFRGAKKEAQNRVDNVLNNEQLQEEIRRKVIKEVNKKVNLPLLGEKGEAIVIGIVYDVIRNVVLPAIKEKL